MARHGRDDFGRGGSEMYSTIRQGILALAVVACVMTGAAIAQIGGVASVVDGDTIEISGKRIRLSGFDTPESGKRCGSVNVHQRAALALSDFIGTRTVSCVDTGDRNSGRIVATCAVGGTDLGAYMVSQGWARDWPRYSDGKYCSAEKRARGEGKGIWGMSCRDDLWGNRNYDGCM